MLFDNLALASTITTDVDSASYPVENLAHQFLRRRYQIVGTTATVTITFAADSTVDCFFYAHHNCTAMELRLYDSGDSLLETISITSPETEIGSEFFTAVASVAYAELDLTGPGPTYLGGVGIGQYYEAPRPLAAFPEGVDDNSLSTQSPAGQVQFLHVAALRERSYTFAGMTRAIRAEIEALLTTWGVGRPMWIDVFYGDHSFEPPIYGRVTTQWKTTKSGAWYNADAMTIKEAR